MHFSLAKDVINLGWHEDGYLYADVFHIHATNEYGERWVSDSIDRTWIDQFRHDKNATLKMVDRIMFMPSRWEPEQIFAVGQLAIDFGFITEGNLMLNVAEQRLNPENWYNGYPVFGTQAYLDYAEAPF